MADRFEFTLGSVEAAVVGRALNADVRRFPLRIRNTTVDPVRYTKLAILVRDELAERGLSSADQLHPSVRTAMELFNAHQVSVSVTGWNAKQEDLAMVAMSDGAQALAVTQAPKSDTLCFSLFADEDLVSTIAGFLPGTRATPERTFTVEHRPAPAMSAMAQLRRAEAEETDAFRNVDVVGQIAAEPKRRPQPKNDTERLAEMMSGERLGSGFLAATGRRRTGELRSAPPVGWVDTGQGRYLVETTTAANGATVATFRPSGATELATTIRHVISSVY
ncbi:MAG: ESX secretion-associated protein EspG [Actinophytocola sp.]|uniref:ESX secretion-associated protein EspG n=1 Tax=Actinophytocola sp. TaxID=1872138 RepID=UPI003C726511